MHKLTRILDDSTPDVDDASGIQSRIRVFLPPEASTFAAVVQVSAKTNVDESLQTAKCLACVGVAEVINPSPHRLIHLFNKLRGRYWPRRLVKYLIRRRILRCAALLGKI
jgi:hypothetical protein